MTDRDTMLIPSESPDKDGVDADEPADSVLASTNSPDSSTARDLLAAIADPDCQTILAASAEQSLSVSDVVERCDIPTATAYRKVNMLVDTGLLHERIQIHPYGRNEYEYSLRIDTIHVNLTESGSPEAIVKVTDEEANSVSGHAITDGGRATHGEEEESSSRGLASMFVDVTGTEELVEEQEIDRPSRQLEDAGERTVSEYVSAVTKDDGLSDSLPDPDRESQ